MFLTQNCMRERVRGAKSNEVKRVKAVGIDIGTTTICSVVIDVETGELLEADTKRNESRLPEEFPGAYLQDPERILAICLESLENIFDKYTDIYSIGVTGQMHGILYLDPQGNAVSPLYTWQDHRGDQPFKGETYATWISIKSGFRLSSGYGAVTHFYNAYNRLVSERASVLCTIPDYVVMKLSGRVRPVLHASMAASIGMYDGEKELFDYAAIKHCGLQSDFFPEVVKEIPVGMWRGAIVTPAFGDNQACFLGAVGKDGNVLVNIGTGSQVSVYSSQNFCLDEIESRPYIGKSYLLCGASLCGGYSYEICKNFIAEILEKYGVFDVKDFYSVMNQIAEETYKEKKQKCEKVIIETTFNGTRADGTRKGKILNLTEKNFRPGDFCLGILEGVIKELHEFYLKMPKEVRNAECVIVSGNGMRRNRVMRKLCGEIFEADVRLPLYKEEASYGAALFSLLAAGVIKDRTEIYEKLRYEQG